MRSGRAQTETTMHANVPRNSKDDLKLVDLLLKTGQIQGGGKDVSIQGDVVMADQSAQNVASVHNMET